MRETVEAILNSENGVTLDSKDQQYLMDEDWGVWSALKSAGKFDEHGNLNIIQGELDLILENDFIRETLEMLAWG